MRLDVFLKVSRLIPKRTLANEFTKAGLIEVNERVAKSSHRVSRGDSITINRRNTRTTVRVLSVPRTKQVSKKDANNLYEVLAHQRKDPLTD